MFSTTSSLRRLHHSSESFLLNDQFVDGLSQASRSELAGSEGGGDGEPGDGDRRDGEGLSRS